MLLWCISAINETVIEGVSLSSLNLRQLQVRGRCNIRPLYFWRRYMENLKMYEISRGYVSYLSAFAPHLFRNSKSEQTNERKYIGIVLQINSMDYFVPLSSFKPKHKRMPDMIDFIKIRDYAVINLNNMFPVPSGEYSYVDFSSVKDPRYKSLLLAEYRYIKSIQDIIRKNAADLYQYKLENKDDTSLAKRCNDFVLLENKCAEYRQKVHT